MTHILLAFFLFISSCCLSEIKNINVKNDTTTLSKRVLMVYLSRTNNTKAIAEIIHNDAGGTLVALKLEKPYLENYQTVVQQVVNENETGHLPPLKTKIDSIENYDVVFVGFFNVKDEIAAANEKLFKAIRFEW